MYSSVSLVPVQIHVKNWLIFFKFLLTRILPIFPDLQKPIFTVHLVRQIRIQSELNFLYCHFPATLLLYLVFCGMPGVKKKKRRRKLNMIWTTAVLLPRPFEHRISIRIFASIHIHFWGLPLESSQKK